MVLFIKHIRELLFHYDCVIIPDFGGFVCSFSPAKIHPVQHRFYPPGKKISFNKMLVMNDGLLAHHTAVSEGITYKEALTIIQDEVKNWKDSLLKGESVKLEGIGRFFNDGAGNLQFSYETDINFLADSYGLTSFQSLPIDRSEKLKVVHKKETAVEKEKSSPYIHKLAKYSVAAAILSVAALTAFKMQLVPDVHLNEISLNPFKSEKAVYESVKYDNFEKNETSIGRLEDKVSKNDDTWFEYSTDIDGVSKSLTVKLKDPIAEAPPSEVNIYGKFHVVGGCFGVESNAKKMVRKLKRLGFEADMNTIHKGLHVVSYQTLSDENDARQLLARVKSEHNNQAWLLVK